MTRNYDDTTATTLDYGQWQRTPEVQEYARERGIDCPTAVEELVNAALSHRSPHLPDIHWRLKRAMARMPFGAASQPSRFYNQLLTAKGAAPADEMLDLTVQYLEALADTLKDHAELAASRDVELQTLRQQRTNIREFLGLGR